MQGGTHTLHCSHLSFQLILTIVPLSHTRKGLAAAAASRLPAGSFYCCSIQTSCRIVLALQHSDFLQDHSIAAAAAFRLPAGSFYCCSCSIQTFCRIVLPLQLQHPDFLQDHSTAAAAASRLPTGPFYRCSCSIQTSCRFILPTSFCLHLPPCGTLLPGHWLTSPQHGCLKLLLA